MTPAEPCKFHGLISSLTPRADSAKTIFQRGLTNAAGMGMCKREHLLSLSKLNRIPYKLLFWYVNSSFCLGEYELSQGRISFCEKYNFTKSHKVFNEYQRTDMPRSITLSGMDQWNVFGSEVS